jgi:hypothetical protein
MFNYSLFLLFNFGWIISINSGFLNVFKILYADIGELGYKQEN